MLETHLTDIFTALDRAHARYLVAGGLAVVAHGHARFTADLDLVVALDPENATRAVSALADLGYRPRAPVHAADFADAGKRSLWLREKGMLVFQLVSAEREETAVDLFIQEPFNFDAEYAKAPRMVLVPGVETPVIRYETLIEMKRKAGRPQDIEDIRRLELGQKPIDDPDIPV